MMTKPSKATPDVIDGLLSDVHYAGWGYGPRCWDEGRRPYESYDAMGGEGLRIKQTWTPDSVTCSECLTYLKRVA